MKPMRRTLEACAITIPGATTTPAKVQQKRRRDIEQGG
jgi:hypothetical protein